MNKIQSTLLAATAIGFALAGTGCATVTSSLPSVTNATGEGWYTEGTGIGPLMWKSRVWYCPASHGPGHVTCAEAKMVENDEANPGSDAATGNANASPPAPSPPPPPPSAPSKK